jgi:hypothetical protein
VLLGYSNSHKGFKCLDSSEGCVYVTRGVVFDEHVFPLPYSTPMSVHGCKLNLSPRCFIKLVNYAILHDQHLVSSTPANASSSYAGGIVDAEANTGFS